MVFNIDIYLLHYRHRKLFLALDDSAVEKREINCNFIDGSRGKEIILTEEILSLDWE